MDVSPDVTSSELVDSADGMPAYCKAEGTIREGLDFEVRLPASNWNRKLLTLGKAEGAGCNAYLKRGYACSPIFPTGTSRTSKSKAATKEAQDSRAQMDDFFVRGHMVAITSKAIVDRYYSAPPAQSYLQGCSGGGYEALIAAQSFPWDYDGIIVGDANMDIAEWSVRVLWTARNLQDHDGNRTLSDDDLQLVHRAVLAQCDRDDGVKDGVLGDALNCNFDPASLLCSAGVRKECLASSQVEAVKRIYAGPTTSEGVKITTAGLLPGSELHWGSVIKGLRRHAALHLKNSFAGSKPAIVADTFDFDRDYQRLGQGALDARTNPDLRRLKAAGAKLIVYQSANDFGHGARSIIDYYGMVERAMGGRASTEDFLRFFLIPGADHCGGGVGAHAIDYLGYLEAWVERGNAPDVMIGAHIESSEQFLEFPLRQSSIEFTRPVYPYPLSAKYQGKGNPNDAASFSPTRRRRLHETQNDQPVLSSSK